MKREGTRKTSRKKVSASANETGVFFDITTLIAFTSCSATTSGAWSRITCCHQGTTQRELGKTQKKTANLTRDGAIPPISLKVGKQQMRLKIWKQL